jgi:hypothetical protein
MTSRRKLFPGACILLSVCIFAVWSPSLLESRLTATDNSKKNFNRIWVSGSANVQKLPKRLSTSEQLFVSEKSRFSVGEVYERVISSNASFLLIERLGSKALPSMEDRSQLSKIVSDEGEIQTWIKSLSEVNEDELDTTSQIVRMFSLSALSIAAQWKENPQRVLIEGQLFEAFTEKLSRPSMTSALKSSLVMDKIELWGIIKKNFPEAAEQFQTGVQDEAIRSLVEEANKHVNIF